VLLTSVMSIRFLINSSTELHQQHYLCSTTLCTAGWRGGAQRWSGLTERHTVRTRKIAVLGLWPDFYGGAAGARGGAEKYSAQARAVRVVSRYDLGLPGYCVQAYQAMLGVPVPDATQWDQIEHVGNCAYRVFRQMEQVAAQGTLIFHDDTAVRILALMQENRDRLAAAQAQGLAIPPDRLGMHTTALVVKVGEHTAILYYSSRRHAGENLQGLLDKREASLTKPLAMSDVL
jgi:hypothetical protein